MFRLGTMAGMVVLAGLALTVRTREGGQLFARAGQNEEHVRSETESSPKQAGGEPHEAPEETHESGAKCGELKLDAEAQERLGIRLAKLEAATLRPEIRAVGVIEEDPA